ncbi:MAG: RGCVC family protein [Jatrophihabitans sp.]
MSTTEPEIVARHDDAAHERCAVCSHPLDCHDRISLRFCQATQSQALSRGCVCPRTG